MTRRVFGSLLGLVFLVNFGRTAFAPLVEPLQRAFGVGPATVGFAVTLVWLGTALPRLPLGVLLTSVRRERVVLFAGGLLAAASAATALVTTPLALQAGALAVGVATGVYFAAGTPLVSELYPERVGRVVGIHGMAAQSAAVVAPAVVVGILSVTSWRGVFWALSVAALVGTGALWVAIRRHDERRVRTEKTDGDGGRKPLDWTQALRNWRLVLAGMLMIATAGFVWQGLFNFYVSFMLSRGLSSGVANTLLTVVFAAGIPAFWLSGRFVDRFPTVPYVISLLVVFTAGVFALTLVRGLPALVVSSLVVGYAVHGLFPALDTYVLDALPADGRAGTYAVFSGLSLLVEANGSGAVGALTEAGYAFETVFAGLATVLSGVIAVLTLLYLAGRIPGSERGRDGTVGAPDRP